MKKVPMLLATTLVAVALAGCGNRGDSSSSATSSAAPSSSGTSVTPSTSSSQPAPSKTAWTKDEKDFMKAALEYSLPFAHGLTIDTEEDEVVLALGDVVTSQQAADYGAKFEGAGYEFVEEAIEYDSQTGYPIKNADVYTVAPFDDSEMDPLIYRINSQDPGYFPVYGQVVAVGLDEDSHLLVVSTEWAAGMENEFSSTYGGYGITSQYPLSMYYGYFTQSAIYATCDSKATTEQLSAWIALFGTIESDGADFVGADDYQYEFPFTFGNTYSSSYKAIQDIYVGGITEAEMTTFGDDLETLGYEKTEETGYSTYQLVSTEDGIQIDFALQFVPDMFTTEDGGYISFAITWLTE